MATIEARQLRSGALGSRVGLAARRNAAPCESDRIAGMVLPQFCAAGGLTPIAELLAAVGKLSFVAMLALVLTTSSAWGQGACAARPDANRMAIYRFTAATFGLDPNLLQAIAAVESGGNAYAVSPKGAEGVMQLMPGTARQYGVRDPFSPAQNIFGAGLFLSDLKWRQLDRSGRPASLPEILAAYNAGPAAVQRYGGIPPYPDVKDYVRRVLIRYLFGIVPGRLPQKRIDGFRLNRRVPQERRRPHKPVERVDALAQLAQIRALRMRAKRRLVQTGHEAAAHR